MDLSAHDLQSIRNIQMKQWDDCQATSVSQYFVLTGLKVSQIKVQLSLGMTATTPAGLEKNMFLGGLFLFWFSSFFL